ncbi:MAG: hypothetical protein U9O64_11560 [Campylobacterota bacterium]|nr:hypothetical protein [Campylobacterota bacterium]
MTIKNIFFDANIFNDIFDKNRPAFTKSSKAYLGALRHGMNELIAIDSFTSTSWFDLLL